MLLEIARNFYFNTFFPPKLDETFRLSLEYQGDEDAPEDDDWRWDWEEVEFDAPVWLQSIISENKRLRAAEAVAIAWSVSLAGMLFIGAQTWLLTRL